MCGCEKNIKTFKNGGNVDEKCVLLYDIVDLDGSIVEKDLTEEALIEWANTYDWYDLMDVSEDFPVGKIDNVEDAIKSIEGVDKEGDYSVVKKELEESEKLENGGVIESFRRFTEGDFNRLTYDDFEGRWSGYVWVIKHKDSSKILGKFNPKRNTLFILGKKDLTNPLVKWLQQNSFVSSDEYRKLENGGGVGDRKVFFSIYNDYIGNLELGISEIEINNQIHHHGFTRLSDAINSLFAYLKSEDGKYVTETYPKSRYTIEQIDTSIKLKKHQEVPQKVAYSILAKEVKGLDEIHKLERGGKISKNKNWIADALSGGKNKGALRRTALRKGLLRNEDEKLSMTDLHKLEKVGGKTAKRAYLAETLRKFDNGGLINENWGNDGSTPSNNEDYNRLYAFFPDNHSQAKYIWNQLSDKQKSGFIYDLEVTDAASEHIAESWLEFINSSSQDDYWENATNWDEMKNGGTLNKKDEVYIEFLNKDKGFKEDKKSFKSYHEAVEWARENFERFDTDMIKYYKNGGEVGGHGWGDFEKGAKISSLKDVKVGELYLDYNNFFNSKNIILITSGDTTGLNRDIVYASFVRPNNLKGREETFAIWGHDLEGKIDLYKIEGRKYEFGGNVDLDIYPDEDLRYTNRKIKKSKEALVRENIYNGEIQEYILKTIIGKEPEYPIQIVGSLKLTKCFLRPYYKI